MSGRTMLKGTISAVQSHATSLTNTFSVVLVLGTELLIGNNLFQCPCVPADYLALLDPRDPKLRPLRSRVYYASAFIVWPAVAVFVMALAISGATLRCLTGYRRHCSISRHCHSLRYLLENSATSFVPPLAWLVVVFMDGRYYECATSILPSSCLPELKKINQSLAANHARLAADNQHARSISQIIGLTCLGGGVCIAGLMILCGQLCSNLTYYQRRYMQSFRDKEMETFADISEEVITKKLKDKWRNFFGEADSEDWVAISGLPTGEPMEVKGQTYYTNFHAWRPDDDTDGAGSGGGDNTTKDAVEMTAISPVSASKESHPPEGEGVPPLTRQLVELPIGAESGAICHGQLATLFVPVKDGRLWRAEDSASNTKDGATQTREKHFKNKRDSKKVVFEVNEGFETERTGKDSTENGNSQTLDLKPTVPMPKVEISNVSYK